MYIWNTVIVLSKILFYVGFACIAGYTFFSQFFNQVESDNKLKIEQLKLFNWVKVSVVAALIANVISFFASTGAMAEEGIQGAFDPDMLDIMWDSSIGDGTLLRIIGLTLTILALVLPFRFRSTALSNCLKQGILMFSLLTLAYSYTLLGHVSELGVFERALLIFHVLVMAWWFGALFPLKQACHVLDDDKLYLLMETFGKQASVVVSLLLLAGLLLAIQLVSSVEALLTSSYGQTLLLKLLFVISILAIAVKHKLKLVPQIKNNDGRKALSKSISIEMLIAVAILFISAGLTSVVGPSN